MTSPARPTPLAHNSAGARPVSNGSGLSHTCVTTYASARASGTAIRRRFCHFGLESLGTTVQARAWYIDQVRRLNLLPKWSLPCQGCARRPGQRPRENIARNGRNGNFFAWYSCQLGMVGIHPKPCALAIYNTRSTPRGLPFRVIHCHLRL